jgi:hypothetical protein
MTVTNEQLDQRLRGLAAVGDDDVSSWRLDGDTDMLRAIVAAERPASTAQGTVDNIHNISLDGVSFRCAPSGSNGCP